MRCTRGVRAVLLATGALAVAPPSCCTIGLWSDGGRSLLGTTPAGYVQIDHVVGELWSVPDDPDTLRLVVRQSSVTGLGAGARESLLVDERCFEVRPAASQQAAFASLVAPAEDEAWRGPRLFAIDDERGGRRWLLHLSAAKEPLPEHGDVAAFRSLVVAGGLPCEVVALPGRARGDRFLGEVELCRLRTHEGPGVGTTVARVALTPVALACDVVGSVFVVIGYVLLHQDDDEEEAQAAHARYSDQANALLNRQPFP